MLCLHWSLTFYEVFGNPNMLLLHDLKLQQQGMTHSQVP
jgi:hypothetical protein